MQRVLLTGAAGHVGGYLRESLRDVYPVLRLTDCQNLSPAGSGEEVCQADLSDAAAAEQVVANCDAIVHFGAISAEDEWESILKNNVIATYNIFEAARRCGVHRIVFASTLHVTGFYPCSQTIDSSMPVRPDSRYGVSKVFGEALGRLYADKHNLGCVCLRIGTFAPKPRGERMLSTWISPRDTTQLIRRSLDAADIHFEILY
ncbi:MAG: NAD(P)-dependent oxidoreductase, partial [Rhodospirillales bacterium]|nr:NAD(P)-dependent oxidoreductase [Rhodospirillales bacterium]